MRHSFRSDIDHGRPILRIEVRKHWPDYRRSGATATRHKYAPEEPRAKRPECRGFPIANGVLSSGAKSPKVRSLNESTEVPWTRKNAPWVTALGTVLAIGIFASPHVRQLLAYDRLRVDTGDWWRVLTGSFVHFSGRELAWNLGVLIPAGTWAERISPVRARLLWLVAPLLIGAIVQVFLPDVLHFAGLSGVAAAAVAFLALAHLRSTTTDRWFWRLVLGLLALKIAAEALLASRFFSLVPDPSRRAAALIHLAGLCTGSLLLSARRRKRGRTR